MADGLPWVRITSEIAFDGEIELISDAAFRTFVELIAISGYYLFDGEVPMRTARKLCNTAHLNRALKELSSGERPYITIDKETITIPAYSKWQETSEQVKRRRKADAERQRRHRESVETADGSNADSNDRCHAVTDGVSPNVKSKSKSKSKELEEEDNHSLLEAARGIPGWKPSPKDDLVIAAGVERLGEDGCRNVILKLKTRQAATGQYKDLRRTLSNWLNSERVTAPNNGNTPEPPATYGETSADIPEYIREGYRKQGYDC